jgi:hypothetical protein
MQRTILGSIDGNVSHAKRAKPNPKTSSSVMEDLWTDYDDPVSLSQLEDWACLASQPAGEEFGTSDQEVPAYDWDFMTGIDPDPPLPVITTVLPSSVNAITAEPTDGYSLGVPAWLRITGVKALNRWFLARRLRLDDNVLLESFLKQRVRLAPSMPAIEHLCVIDAVQRARVGLAEERLVAQVGWRHGVQLRAGLRLPCHDQPVQRTRGLGTINTPYYFRYICSFLWLRLSLAD